MIRRILANCTVTDLPRAEHWYSQVFDCQPDARPMPGLIEWHLGESFGVQVWSDPDRAGKCTVVLEETDLDHATARLTAVGISHDGPVSGGGARILQLTDPDGNRVVLAGS
ncbi:MAG: VOC family protein [Antricoccus sp.]